jgi:phage terminase large subunit-like protein
VIATRDYAATALQYASDVIAGRVVACKWAKLACQRQINDLRRAESDESWPYVFDADEAARACEFIEHLPHVEGVWDTPTITLQPWQIFVRSCVFGWRQRENPEFRRFTTAYISVARKNAKSTEASGTSLYGLAMEGEVGPQVKCAATTGDQARIVFDVARKMVEATPDLQSACGIEVFANSIVCRENGGTIKPINAKASTQDGLNPHLTIIDELHAHKERALFDVLRSASGARKNPLSWYVTTAGYNVESVCYEQETLVKKILEGIIEADHYFGIIYTLDDRETEAFDERAWPKSNPNLGASVQVKGLRDYALEAKESPDSYFEFLTKRMNVWPDGSLQGHINMTKWKACSGAVHLEELVSVPCYAGLDLASTSDLTALALAWLVKGRLKLWVRAWLPETAVKPRTERYNVPYQRWVDAGHIVTTPGDVTDFKYIENEIGALTKRFNVKSIRFDPWEARDLVNRLLADNYPMVEFPQTISHYTSPVKFLDRHYLGGTLDHGDNPVLGWCASNVVVRRDANDNVAPDRKKKVEKIDLYTASVMACDGIQAQQNKRSKYEDGGLTVLEVPR